LCNHFDFFEGATPNYVVNSCMHRGLQHAKACTNTFARLKFNFLGLGRGFAVYVLANV